MVKNRNTPEYHREITSDLYFDILEKFCILKAENARIKIENKAYRHQLEVYKVFCKKDATQIEQLSNKNLDGIIKILYHNKSSKESIEAVKALKFSE